ncbi:sulfite exporter TauE/SafE family protein [Candidatus Acidulodesulfobacterium sp. H_13]|uniref:sulfite exporter TauE/SafE family protein n=1 Tax=Candidatus Acidulodesulfobacterium sp. H_13 TaxID=3395470 RepID=UPI003AF59CF6
MHPISTFDIIAGIVIVLIAFFVRATIGFGSGLISVSLLTIFIPISITVPAVFVLDFLGSILLGAYDFKEVEWNDLSYLLPATVFGLLFGAYILKYADPQKLTIFLGIFILAYVIYAMSIKQDKLPYVKNTIGVPLGFLGGFIGSLYGGGGPPIVAYLQMKHHGKRTFRATFQIVAITDSVFRLFIYTFLGLLTLKALKLSAVLIPPVLIGLFLGNKFHFVINQKTFYYMVMIILSLAATALILHSIF